MDRGPARALATTALASLTLLWGCGDGPTVPRTPAATPTPAPQATPTPAPLPTPTPEPTATANRPPTVTVTSSGGCHPKPTRACTVSLNATATDPDGDNLRYGWDGCAQGNAPLALCTINAPGRFTATVLVDDGNGGLARASGVAEGTNLPPNIHMAHIVGPVASNTLITLMGQQPDDPEDDDDPNTLCSRAKLVVSGPCRATLFECGGVSDGFGIDVSTLQGPGTCVIEARVPDIWGAVGVDRMVFNVLP